MSKSTMPSDWKYCAMCTYWSGKLTPKDYSNYTVEFERDENALCTYWRICRKAETSACPNWEARFKKR